MRESLLEKVGLFMLRSPSPPMKQKKCWENHVKIPIVLTTIWKVLLQMVENGLKSFLYNYILIASILSVVGNATRTTLSMKSNLTIIILFLLLLQVSFAQSKQLLPIIDMHLHSIGINDNGPPPVNVGAPFRNFGSHDPVKPYAPNFIRILKTDSLYEYTITSPATDDDLMNESFLLFQVWVDIVYCYQVTHTTWGFWKYLF